jgi:hypothetical protein
MSFLAESCLCSSCDGATGDELLARFLFLRGKGVFTAWDPRHISCSSGDGAGCGACRDESSTLPTRSASGSLVVAGVDGGGQSTMVGNFGVLFVVPTSFTTLEVFGVLIGFVAFPSAAGRFSFSASRSFAVSTEGAPSMNWKALSFLRVCVEGMIGGPVTTCCGWAAAAWLLWWWGNGPLRPRLFHWPRYCYEEARSVCVLEKAVKVKVPLASDPDQRRTFVASTLDDGVDSVDVMDALIG